jgi:hypothetical protein
MTAPTLAPTSFPMEPRISSAAEGFVYDNTDESLTHTLVVNGFTFARCVAPGGYLENKYPADAPEWLAEIVIENLMHADVLREELRERIQRARGYW